MRWPADRCARPGPRPGTPSACARAVAISRGRVPSSIRALAASQAGLLLCALLLALMGCGGEPPVERGPRVERPEFSGTRAYGLVETQVAFGPRVPETEGHARQLAWMIAWLEEHADTVVADTFAHITTAGDTLTLTNVTARYRPELDSRLLLLTHWDTRPQADRSSDEDDRSKPVPGANDGASGTAVLLELASLLSEQGPTVGVDLLFLDGEDYGPGTEDMFIGSARFADRVDPDTYKYGVLLDMVGDVDPSFPAEAYSSELAPQIVQRVWGVARSLGYGRYFPLEVGPRVNDDHIPLNEAGIPTVNVIDFEYGSRNALWHTPDDVPENVSPTTLRMVGEVVAELVYLGG